MRTRTSLLAVAAIAAALVLPAPATHSQSLTVLGHGQHTEGPTKVVSAPFLGARTVGPLTASFSVGLDHAMCAVGEASGEVAPFNMLVYATDITHRIWGTDDESGRPTYTLQGTARSVTMVGSAVVEDVLTPFSATAYDSGDPLIGDYFHISIDTVLFPHTTFGKDLDGNPLPLFAGDVAIGKGIAGPS